MYTGFNDHIENNFEIEDEPSPTIRESLEESNSYYPTTVKGQKYAPKIFDYGGLQAPDHEPEPDQFVGTKLSEYYQPPDPYAKDKTTTLSDVLGTEKSQEAYENDPSPEPIVPPVMPPIIQNHPKSSQNQSDQLHPEKQLHMPGWWNKCMRFLRGDKSTIDVFVIILWLIAILLIFVLVLIAIEKIQTISRNKRYFLQNNKSFPTF